MRCFLFWATAHKDKEHGRPVRPVSWEAPDMALSPHYISLTEERRAWLAAQGDPVWFFGYDAFRNAEQLEKRLGYWPEPIEVDVAPVPEDFDDDIPF